MPKSRGQSPHSAGASANLGSAGTGYSGRDGGLEEAQCGASNVGFRALGLELWFALAPGALCVCLREWVCVCLFLTMSVHV